MSNKITCPQCGSTDTTYYDGALGYEAVRCNSCNEETDLNNDHNHCPRPDRIRALVDAQKLELYRANRYYINSPPVSHANWTEADWIQYIDINNWWLPIETPVDPPAAVKAVNLKQYETELDILARTARRLREMFELDLKTLHADPVSTSKHEDDFLRHIIMSQTTIEFLIQTMSNQFELMTNEGKVQS